VKTILSEIGIVVALTIFVSFVPFAFAVESDLGRPISGMQITSYTRLIPPEPGLARVQVKPTMTAPERAQRFMLVIRDSQQTTKLINPIT
jgi:hypothetical protein